DRRTVRYYTTLGLIDRPAELRGRTAYYGRKHVLQLVAIKRMQARGLALADIQRRLLGLSEPELAPLAQLPDEAAPPSPTPKESAGQAGRAFWATLPAPPATPVSASEDDQPDPASLRLGPGAFLLVETRRPLRPDDVSAIRAGA